MSELKDALNALDIPLNLTPSLEQNIKRLPALVTFLGLAGFAIGLAVYAGQRLGIAAEPSEDEAGVKLPDYAKTGANGAAGMTWAGLSSGGGEEIKGDIEVIKSGSEARGASVSAYKSISGGGGVQDSGQVSYDYHAQDTHPLLAPYYTPWVPPTTTQINGATSGGGGIVTPTTRLIQ